MKVFTFFHHVPDLNLEDEYRLLMLWRQRWQAKGFEPVVLNQHVAARHPFWEDYSQRMALMPSVNPSSYDQACWWRWLAMVQVGGGIMCDHDCLPYGDNDFNERLPGTLVCFQGHVPSLCWGTANAYLAMCKSFMDYQPGERDLVNDRQHVSDMLVMAHGGATFQQRFLVKNYGEEGWEESPFIHWASSSLAEVFKAQRGPRWKVIPQLERKQ